MPTVIVDVMPKDMLLDPQGKAVAGVLTRTGHAGISGVRVGKRFELTVDEPVTPEMHRQITTIAHNILSNSVIEDVVSIRVGTTHEQ
ncbi:MAG: phosphoribosylformylglycinamidine synthase, purS protein [Candidatus Lumbricidophila eiseniae]|uniref:Phosphoribosylformylglycinamidine synthase subunit PurS n=1 Tax=Candidatus Lumbricidiphila eiseniae TaxID=1969409 RepID=A0A2A6FUJ4_9MICO|nr:MAG: phosphoribosylformylglycinamidine synthase, purS protein [Candidatus Lumbricidophila eiseniae]